MPGHTSQRPSRSPAFMVRGGWRNSRGTSLGVRCLVAEDLANSRLYLHCSFGAG